MELSRACYEAIGGARACYESIGGARACYEAVGGARACYGVGLRTEARSELRLGFWWGNALVYFLTLF